MQLSHITKRFGAILAVDDVSLRVDAGDLVALAGQNGAGKTTLMRIAAGDIAPDAGTLGVDGRVALVHQHFMLVPQLTIAENLALVTSTGFRFVSRRQLERDAEAAIRRSRIALHGVGRKVADLSVGEQAKLELIKAIASRPSVLILDEPTAVLTPGEASELFEVMRELAAGGTAVIFISHKLPEVLSVARRILVMRGGKVVLDTAAAETDAQQLATAMTPDFDLTARPARRVRRNTAAALPVLQAQGLELRAGEILSVVGVAGNGQRELALGLRRRLDSRSSGHIPEDRTRDGVIAQMTVAENLALKQTRWSPQAAARHAGQMIALYSIRARGPLQTAGELSGGNQQKLVLARELDRRPSIIVAAEPTRGLDVASTRFVHQQLASAADAGAAVLLITSDLDEAFALGDAIQVIYRGRLSAPMPPEQAATRVGALMAGVG